MNISQNKRTLMMSGAVMGLLGALLAFMGNPKNMAICVACFIRDSAGAMKLHTASAVQYMRPEIAGFVCGAFLIAVITKEYRSAAGSSPMLRFLLGFIMMAGSLAFLGCPLRMLIRMSAGDLNAYVGLLGFGAGVFTGTAALKRGFTLGRAYPSSNGSGAVLPVLLIVLLLLYNVTALFASSETGPGSMHAPVLVSLAAGLIFGAIAQKNRACFAGSLRDVFLMKNFDLLSIIGGFFIVMLAFNLLTGGFKLSFEGQPISHSHHLWNFLGLYAVGFAAVLAGGCPLRQLVLAGQGSSDSAVTFLGLLVGAAFCHNFGLAAGAAAAATETTEAVSGGLTPAGKTVLVVSIGVLFLIGFKKREKTDKK